MSGPFNYIPFGDNPGQLYPLASQDTYASQGAALSVIGSGGSGPSPGPVPANLAVSTLAVSSIINFQDNTGAITNLSTVNGVPYVAGGSGAVPANLAVSSLNVNNSGDITLIGNTGGASIDSFPSITWRNNLPSLAGAFSTICLDMSIIHPYVVPPGAPSDQNANYCAPTFEVNGPNGSTTCPIAVSALVIGFDTKEIGTPSIFTPADSVSTLYIAATSSITFQTASLAAPAAVVGVSSMNGIYMDWAKISTLAGAP